MENDGRKYTFYQDPRIAAKLSDVGCPSKLGRPFHGPKVLHTRTRARALKTRYVSLVFGFKNVTYSQKRILIFVFVSGTAAGLSNPRNNEH